MLTGLNTHLSTFRPLRASARRSHQRRYPIARMSTTTAASNRCSSHSGSTNKRLVWPQFATSMAQFSPARNTPMHWRPQHRSTHMLESDRENHFSTSTGKVVHWNSKSQLLRCTNYCKVQASSLRTQIILTSILRYPSASSEHAPRSKSWGETRPKVRQYRAHPRPPLLQLPCPSSSKNLASHVTSERRHHRQQRSKAIWPPQSMPRLRIEKCKCGAYQIAVAANLSLMTATGARASRTWISHRSRYWMSSNLQSAVGSSTSKESSCANSTIRACIWWTLTCSQSGAPTLARVNSWVARVRAMKTTFRFNWSSRSTMMRLRKLSKLFFPASRTECRTWSKRYSQSGLPIRASKNLI